MTIPPEIQQVIDEGAEAWAEYRMLADARDEARRKLEALDEKRRAWETEEWDQIIKGGPRVLHQEYMEAEHRIELIKSIRADFPDVLEVEYREAEERHHELHRLRSNNVFTIPERNKVIQQMNDERMQVLREFDRWWERIQAKKREPGFMRLLRAHSYLEVVGQRAGQESNPH